MSRPRPAGLAVALALLVACGAKITQANFDRVETDMSRDEVIAILGEPTESASVGFGPFEGTSSVWEDEGAKITIQFFDGRVKLKHFEKTKR